MYTHICVCKSAGPVEYPERISVESKDLHNECSECDIKLHLMLELLGKVLLYWHYFTSTLTQSGRTC